MAAQAASSSPAGISAARIERNAMPDGTGETLWERLDLTHQISGFRKLKLAHCAPSAGWRNPAPAFAPKRSRARPVICCWIVFSMEQSNPAAAIRRLHGCGTLRDAGCLFPSCIFQAGSASAGLDRGQCHAILA
jgi:hypothetical protein